MNTPAGQAYLNSILSLYNSWGVDFIKVDNLTNPYYGAEVEGYAKAVASVSREIVFSTSPGPTPLNMDTNVIKYANMWRLVDDFWDNWPALLNAFSTAQAWRERLVNGQQISGPGHWLDVDMLPFGHLCLYGPSFGAANRYSLPTLTKGQHKLALFLWCINNGPLMWGGNLPDNTNNSFYDSLMKNSDALFIHQHGTNGKVLHGFSSDSVPVWSSTHPTDTTTKFLGLFNLSNKTATMSVSLASIGINGTVSIKDVWSGKSLGTFTTTFSQSIPARDAGLYILGNGVTGIAPARSSVNPASLIGEKMYFAVNDRFVIPGSFAGKTVKVKFFSLSGKFLNSFFTRDPLITLSNNNLRGEQVRVVKVTEVQ